MGAHRARLPLARAVSSTVECFKELLPETADLPVTRLRAAEPAGAELRRTPACSARESRPRPGRTRRPRGSASGCAPGTSTSRPRCWRTDVTDVWTTPERVALRRLARDFTAREIVPYLGAVGGRRRGAPVTAPAGCRGGAARPRVPDVGRRLGRRRHRQHDRGRGDAVHRRVERPAVGPVHPRHRAPAHHRVGQRRADRPLRQADPRGRADRVTRGDRAGRRIRRRGDPDPGDARRRLLRGQRVEDLHHVLDPSGLRHDGRPHRRRASSRRLAAGRGHRIAGVHRRTPAGEDGVVVQRHRRARRTSTSGCRPGT